MALNFAPLLRGVVLVGQPALGLGLDFCGVRHRPVGCCSEVWCGSAPEGRSSATYAQATTYGRLFAARQMHRPILWDGDGVAVLQPSQGRFLPRLRAAPSGVAFFMSPTSEALVFTASTSPYTVDDGCTFTCYSPASSRPRVRGVRDTARRAAGKHVTTGEHGPVPCVLLVKPRPGGRVRVGVTGELDTARAGPWPASRLPSLNPERLRLHFGNQRRSSKTLRSLSKSPSVASVSDQLQSGFRQ